MRTVVGAVALTLAAAAGWWFYRVAAPESAGEVVPAVQEGTSMDVRREANPPSGTPVSSPITTSGFSGSGASIDEHRGSRVVSGVVVDKSGDPVADAVLDVRKRGLRDESRSDEGTVSWRWSPTPAEDLRSGPDGRFVVDPWTSMTDQDRESVHGIRARHPRYVASERISFTPGETEVRIVLEDAGRVEVRVLLPAGCEQGEIRGRLWEQTDVDLNWRRLRGERVRFMSSAVRVRDGMLRFDSVKPGRYSLRLPGVAIKDVMVRPGELTSDPRLDPIDCRDALQVVTIVVVDEADRFVEGADVWLRSGNNSQGRKTDRRGTWKRTIERSKRWIIDIEKDGYMPHRMETIPSSSRVTLRRSPSVVVDVSPLIWNSLGDLRLLVSLRSTKKPDGGSEPLETDPVEVKLGVAARLQAPAPGPYELHWWLRDATNRATWDIESSPAQLVELQEGDPERRVTATLTSEHVRQGVSRGDIIR